MSKLVNPPRNIKRKWHLSSRRSRRCISVGTEFRRRVGVAGPDGFCFTPLGFSIPSPTTTLSPALSFISSRLTSPVCKRVSKASRCNACTRAERSVGRFTFTDRVYSLSAPGLLMRDDWIWIITSILDGLVFIMTYVEFHQAFYSSSGRMEKEPPRILSRLVLLLRHYLQLLYDLLCNLHLSNSATNLRTFAKFFVASSRWCSKQFVWVMLSRFPWEILAFPTRNLETILYFRALRCIQWFNASCNTQSDDVQSL